MVHKFLANADPDLIYLAGKCSSSSMTKKKKCLTWWKLLMLQDQPPMKGIQPPSHNQMKLQSIRMICQMIKTTKIISNNNNYSPPLPTKNNSLWRTVELTMAIYSTWLHSSTFNNSRKLWTLTARKDLQSTI